MSSPLRLVLLVLLFFGAVALYALELSFFNLYLDRMGLLLTGLGLGLALGIALALVAGPRLGGSSPMARTQISIGLIVLSLLLLPLLLSLSNRLLSFEPAREVEVELLAQEPRYGSRFGVIKGELVEPSSYLTFFHLQDRLFRISTPELLFPDAVPGDRVYLPVRDGLWGFAYIDLST